MILNSSLSFCLIQQTAFTSKKDYGKEDRAAKWIMSQRSLQGVMAIDLEFKGRRSSLIPEQAKRRAEIARYILKLCSLLDYFQNLFSRSSMNFGLNVPAK